MVGLVYFSIGIRPCYSLGCAFEYAEDYWRASILADMGVCGYHQLLHTFP